MSPPARRFVARALARALLLAAVAWLSFAPRPARAVDPTIVRCRVETASVNPDATTTLYIEILNAVDLFGYQLKVYYEPNEIILLDSSAPLPAGVNFALGSFLFNDFVILNQANNTTGVGELAVTQLSPDAHPPQSGSGELAHITLQGVASGLADIHVGDVILSDRYGNSLMHQVQNPCTVIVNWLTYLPLVLR